MGGSPPAWCARSCPRRRSRHPTGTVSAAGRPAHALGGCSARQRGSVPGEQRGPHLSSPLASVPSNRANHPTGQPLPTGVVPPSPCGAVSPLPGAASGSRFPRIRAWEDASPRDEQCPRAAAGLGLSFQAGSDPPAAAHRSSARLSCEGFTPRLGWGLHQHWHQDWGSGARPGAGSGAGTCSRSLSLPTTAALPQSMASEKGSSQPSLSSTGMQAACGGTPQAGTEPPAPGEGVSGAPARPVPAEPRGSGRSPSACPGARCRRWSCAAAPGSQTWNGRWGGGQAWPPLLL